MVLLHIHVLWFAGDWQLIDSVQKCANNALERWLKELTRGTELEIHSLSSVKDDDASEII